MPADQFSHWREAITNGTRIETERGNPRSGFYKQVAGDGRVEVIAIARNPAGNLECFRTVYGDGSRMSESEIDDLFGSVCAYPISEDAFKAVYERNEALPPEYGAGGKLTLKDQQAGVPWTPEYGRKRLGLAENERAAIGGNNPPGPVEDAPATGHKIDGEQTPDKLALAEVSELAAGVKRYLDGLGGKPRSKEEADAVADYATKFAGLHDKADAERKREKQPFLDGGRDVDARWKRPIGSAETGKTRCKAIAQEWRDAENARRADEARKANEHAAAEAERAGQSKPEPITAERVGGLGNIRTVSERTNTIWSVVDARAYLAHLLTLDGELPAEIVEAARKVAQRRGEASPGVQREEHRSAA